MIVALFATMGTLVAQEKYAIIIGGNVNPDTLIIPLAEQWNGGIDPGTYGFDEIWNDAYLAWEMLITDKGYGKGYSVDNVHVLFDNGNDFTFALQDNRYKAGYNNQQYVVDENAYDTTIKSCFNSLANTITEDDFLFVWIMGHGGSDATGHYFYSYDNQKIYATDLASLLNGISAHKKVVYLAFPKSGGFAPVLENSGNIVITSSGATQGASRADDLAPDDDPPYTQPFTENEVLNNITYNHGEMNYHLVSSLTGFTPKGEDQYAGEDLALADSWIVDGFIMMEELNEWINNHESLAQENIVFDNPFLINFFTDSSLEYPTLLFSNITSFNQFVARGLIAVTSGLLLYDDAYLTFSNGSVVDFTTDLPDAWFVDGSSLTIGDGVTFNFLTPLYQFVCQTDNITISGALTINVPAYSGNSIFYFINPDAIISFDALYAYNSNFKFEVDQLEITNSWIQLSMVEITAETSNVDYTFFPSSTLKFTDNDLCRLNNCNLFNIFSEETDETAYTGIYITDCQDFAVNECMVMNYLSDGIRITNSGHGNLLNNVSNNTISGNGAGSSFVDAGIWLYNSNATLSQNNINGSEIGVEILNRSQVSVVGNRYADYVHETQQIHDNSINQVYATDGAFPYEFRFNAIFDDDNTCLVKYVADPLGIEPNLDVIYNYWGTSFDPHTDLCPTQLFTWNPVWNLQVQNPVAENDENLFVQANTLADSGQYAPAKTKYIQLVNDYPESEYAIAALKELLIVEKMSNQEFTALQSYYTTILNQHQDDLLGKTADFLSNLCNIQTENYGSAITWYEDVIQNPPTFADSLFAIIDLGNLYLKIENDSLKSAPIGSLTEYIPQSKKQYTENRDYLISLLFKDEETILQAETDLSDNKSARLLPNYPNPFAGTTTLHYELTEDSKIGINIFDYTGKLAKTLDEGNKEAGKYSTAFFAGELNAGIYFCTIKCNGIISDSQKITIIN